MANEVKWIKLTTDIFETSKIKQLRALPEGNNIVLIWIMILTMAGKCNADGMIILTENVPYTPQMLATELDFDISTIEMALSALEYYNMICRRDECFLVKNWSEYQNVDGLGRIREQTKKRVSEYRERKKLECNVTSNVNSNVTVTQSSISISNTSNSFSESIKEIIDYLNINTNKRYTYNNKSFNRHITARLKDGFTVDEFKLVIDKKCREWKGTEFEQYLKPTTLFSQAHFEEYLNQPEKKSKNDASFLDEIIGGSYTEPTGLQF